MKVHTIEPHFLFITERKNIGTEERPEKVKVTELVRKNQPILAWPKRKSTSQSGSERRAVQNGRNTYFSEDGETLMAATVGYPRTDTIDQENSDQPAILVSIDPLVRISTDEMEATLSLHPETDEGFSPREDTLSELLTEADIHFGLHTENLSKALQILREGCNDYHEIPIASGIPSTAGIDEYLEFAFEIGPIAGKVLEDGTIDFRERKIMIAVNANQLLARRIPAIPGTPGTNVKGEEVEPESGNAIEVKILNDTSFSEETGEIRATKDGILTVIKDSQIRVCSKQVIQGDINYETGNVRSENCISVHGSVQPGFIVEAVGDIEIFNEVSSATVNSDSNIVIKGGITGKNSQVKAAGDVDIKFIEQGAIEAGGNVVIRNQTYYSKVAAGGNIRYQPGAKLIGGTITAGRNVTVANVGTDNSPSCHIGAGVDHERLQHYYELKEMHAKMQNDMIQWMQRHGVNAKARKVRKMQKEIDEIKIKLLKLNLIPGTLKYSRVGEAPVTDDDQSEQEESKLSPLDISKIHIDVPGTMYAGTELRIGNRHMVLTKTITNRRFKLNGNKRRIIASPLRGA